jgi:hypothetical protein
VNEHAEAEVTEALNTLRPVPIAIRGGKLLGRVPKNRQKEEGRKNRMNDDLPERPLALKKKGGDFAGTLHAHYSPPKGGWVNAGSRAGNREPALAFG